jgi:hypothetical protein
VPIEELATVFGELFDGTGWSAVAARYPAAKG